MNKITCICLGVRDMERSIKFYRDGLGYKTDCKENNPPVCFFDTPGTKFELFPLEQLAKDIDENNPPKCSFTVFCTAIGSRSTKNTEIQQYRAIP